MQIGMKVDILDYVYGAIYMQIVRKTDVAKIRWPKPKVKKYKRVAEKIAKWFSDFNQTMNTLNALFSGGRWPETQYKLRVCGYANEVQKNC